MCEILPILLILLHSGELTKVVETHLSPKAGVFYLLLQTPADVRITFGIDPGRQTLPDALHLLCKRNAFIIAMP